MVQWSKAFKRRQIFCHDPEVVDANSSGVECWVRSPFKSDLTSKYQMSVNLSDNRSRAWESLSEWIRLLDLWH